MGEVAQGTFEEKVTARVTILVPVQVGNPRLYCMDDERDDHEDFLRLPGLFRRWEIEQVLKSGRDYHIEDAGEAQDGTCLFSVYERTPKDAASTANRRLVKELSNLLRKVVFSSCGATRPLEDDL